MKKVPQFLIDIAPEPIRERLYQHEVTAEFEEAIKDGRVEMTDEEAEEAQWKSIERLQRYGYIKD